MQLARNTFSDETVGCGENDLLVTMLLKFSKVRESILSLVRDWEFGALTYSNSYLLRFHADRYNLKMLISFMVVVIMFLFSTP